jgi:hypothetical protein
MVQVGRHVKVDEKLYPLGFDADDLVHTLTTLKPKQLEKMSSQLLKTFPNSHSLTKALLEHLLTTNKEVRPTFSLEWSLLVTNSIFEHYRMFQ